MRHEILEVAEGCRSVDPRALEEALDDGRARKAVMEQQKEAEGDEVEGSPHVFVSGGWNLHNPGVEIEWAGDHGKGFPVVTEDDPSVYEEIFRRAEGDE